MEEKKIDFQDTPHAILDDSRYYGPLPAIVGGIIAFIIIYFMFSVATGIV